MSLCVYEHWRADINRPFYVGKGTKIRARNKIRLNKHHTNIVAKIGQENVIIKTVAEGLSDNEAFDLEKERIALWRGLGLRLSNQTNGGEGLSGMKHSSETKSKMSASAKGRTISAEQRAKISENNKRLNKDPARYAGLLAANKGRPKSPEHRAKLSEAAKRRKKHPKGNSSSKEK